MARDKITKDRRIPGFVLNNPVRRLFSKPRKYSSYVSRGQTVADLGCGPGYYTFPLAEAVGPEGKVYAVDSDERPIRTVKKKAEEGGFQNIEAHAGSAAQLGFIPDGSVDFVLADGMLCCMAPPDHPSAVSEIQRILKPGARAYLVIAPGSMSYVDPAEWEAILGQFRVEKRNHARGLQESWALVSRR